MRVLIACEYSGTVRDAFIKRGHDAWSCDILPCESDILDRHYQCDLFEVINKGWDLIIAHPPCTYLTVTGNKWMKPEFKHRFPTREKDRAEAIEFFMKIANADCPRIAIENPVGVMSTLYKKPAQIIQPYHYGHKDSKRTCLWLKGLPNLTPTEIVEPEFYVYAGKKYSKHHADSARLPKHERMKARAKTFQGIADAMADQWGGL